MPYEPQRHFMMELAYDEGVRVNTFYDKYDRYLARAEAEYSETSGDYQRFRAEAQFWNEEFASRHGNFEGVEPPRRSFSPSRAPSQRPRRDHIHRRRSRSPPWSRLRRHRSRSPINNSSPARRSSYVSQPRRRPRSTSPRTFQSPRGFLPRNAPAEATAPDQLPSHQIPLAQRDDELSRLGLFFASLNGRPRFSALCRQDNALHAFIGRASDSHIKGLECEFPRLRFRKERIREGLLIWAELPEKMNRRGFVLSNVLRSMLELAAQLLRAYAAHEGAKLPNIDDFTRRYFDGQCDPFENGGRVGDGGRNGQVKEEHREVCNSLAMAASDS